MTPRSKRPPTTAQGAKLRALKEAADAFAMAHDSFQWATAKYSDQRFCDTRDALCCAAIAWARQVRDDSDPDRGGFRQ